MLRRTLLLGWLVVATPLAAWARLGPVPIEFVTVAPAAAIPAVAAPVCHDATDEFAAAGPCALCASCHLPPAATAPAPAATGSAPRPAATPAPREAERRIGRRQAERLDRPPYIRPM